MKYNFRTDLAIETREAYQKAKQMDIPGVDVENIEDNNVKITRVKVVRTAKMMEILRFAVQAIIQDLKALCFMIIGQNCVKKFARMTERSSAVNEMRLLPNTYSTI